MTDKPTWIWLRGLTREQRHWGAALTQAKAKHRILAIDLPGTGVFNHLTSPSRIDDIALFVRQQALQSIYKPPYALLGVSMGAMVAYAWQQGFPSEICKLILINSSLGSATPFYHRLRPQNYPALAKAIFLSPAQREQVIYDLTCQPHQHRQEIVKHWQAIQKDSPVSLSTFFRQIWAAARYSPPLLPPNCDTEIWLSAKDSLVHPICSRQLAAAWRVPVHEQEHAAHDLPTDAPEWFVRQFECTQQNHLEYRF